MTIPGDLVQAAMDAVMAGPAARPRYEKALAAAFAKLVECPDALEVIERALQATRPIALSASAHGDAQVVAAAFAREFGSQT